MKRNNFFSRFIVVTLTAALLLVSGSRAIRVSALADPVPVTAVYDTQIIQLADYVDSLPQPSVDIFYILCGVLAAAQLGGQEYKLEDPYATSSDVLDWFKSMGIRLYNTVIGLAPNQDPVLGFDVRPYVKPLVAAMMGNAVLSRNYGSVQEFLDSDDEVLVPFQRDIQKSINVIWQIQGGPYHWQFDTPPFTSNTVYAQTTMSELAQYSYNSILEQEDYIPIVRINIYDHARWGQYNARIRGALFTEYHNLFLNTSDHYIRFYNDSGQYFQGYESGNVVYPNIGAYYQVYNGSSSVQSLQRLTSNYFKQKYISNYDSFDTIKELVQAFFDHQFTGNSDEVFYEDFIQHVYVGTNWLDKQELFNVSDLNISEDGNDFYFESPETNDYLIDIKNLITDLVNKTDIWDVVIDNLYDDDGIKIDIPIFGRISISLDEIIDRLDPPVPVDLNDIAELTDNTYLERVKEHARNAGDIFANYVAFWHNCDSDLVYTMFGAAILVLVGAFVGKWGHS